MYEFHYYLLKAYWHVRVHVHYVDTDSFVLSFDTNQEHLVKFLKQSKDELDLSNLEKNRELYNTINKKINNEMKSESSPVLVLDSFAALRSRPYCFSYANRNGIPNGVIQNGIQHTPHYVDYIPCLFNSETKISTNCSNQSNLLQSAVGKQNQLALNPLDYKRMYSNSTKSLPWDIHTQNSACPCLLCLKL